MRIVDAQTAVLTNIEVLAYVTANPPRRPPNPPPNSRHWVPSPDLRDHNTVIKEIHNYAARLSPHILKYPRYIHGEPPSSSTTPPTTSLPLTQQNTPTPLDLALRELITRLQPFGLTKGEVLTIVNLGVGLDLSSDEQTGDDQDEGENEETGNDHDGMEVDGVGAGEEEVAGEVEVEEAHEGEGGLAEEDYGALALLDTVIEEREERLSEEDVAQMLTIIRETLGSRSKGTRETGSVGLDGDG